MSPEADQRAVPFIDLRPQHEPIRAELLQALAQVADSQAFINGPAVADLEREFSLVHQGQQAIGVSSGSDALLMALSALDVGPGDEVITTPFTFIATAEAVVRLGAQPVFADIDPQSMLLDPRSVEDKLSTCTKVILPVHLFGQVGDMDQLSRLARESEVALVEDCAQALGARWSDRAVGTFGQFGAFSFFPTKNLGGWGDGGMLLTGDEALADTARQLRDHGAQERDTYLRPGGNFRLDTLQAALLLVKLGHFQEWLDQRQQAARHYLDLFSQWPEHMCERISLPHPGPAGSHSYGLFVVRTKERDALRRHLTQHNIGTGVYYPNPLHLQPCFASLGQGPGACPQAEAAAEEVLALPLFPGITPEQQERVVQVMEQFFSAREQV